MVETFTVATFRSRAGERFRVRADQREIDVVLVEASAPSSHDERGAPDGARRTPFSVVFRGPLEPVLPQRIYPFRHDELGTFELFVVPIGPDGEGMQYEAVFG